MNNEVKLFKVKDKKELEKILTENDKHADDIIRASVEDPIRYEEGLDDTIDRIINLALKLADNGKLKKDAEFFRHFMHVRSLYVKKSFVDSYSVLLSDFTEEISSFISEVVDLHAKKPIKIGDKK